MDIDNKEPLGISRRDFLKLSGAALGALFVNPQRIEAWARILSAEQPKDVELGEVLPHDERTGIIKANNMPVWMYPVKGDYFYDYWKDKKRTIPATVEEFRINGVEVGYLNLFYLEDTKTKRVSRYTILPHTTGQKGIPIALFDQGTISNGKYVADVRYYSNDRELKATATEKGIEHTILAEFYPNKLVNILEAMKAIDDFQQANGGFKAGQEYSMLKILDLFGRDGYVPGFTSARAKVKGGGVCVIATNMCKLQTLMGAKIAERWQHPTSSRYTSSPFAGWLLRAANSDATVEDSGKGEVYDFRWVATKSGYINLTAAVMPNGKNVKSDFGDGDTGGYKADASILATFRWSDANPGVQSTSLEKLQTAYKNYRKGVQNPPLSWSDRFVTETTWAENDKNSSFLKLVAPEEKVERFATELKNNPFLSGLVELRGLINSYDSKAGIGVGSYLKGTNWYSDEATRLGEGTKGRNVFEAALRHLDYYTNIVKGQPLQCFGLVILLAALSDPLCKFKAIGGATREKDGAPVTCAAELVPKSIQNGSMVSVHRDGMNFRVVTTLEEIMPGDLFVLYNTTVGHVGGVVGKKIVNGETVLLFASANQTYEGNMKIFEVDGNNFDVVVGPDPYKKVIIR